MLLRRLSRSIGGSSSGGRRAAAATTARAAQRQPHQPTPPTPPPTATAAAADDATDPSLAPFIAQIGEKRFTCTQCGKCCTGRGDVWVTEDEARAISLRTRRPVAAFTKSYSKAAGWRLLRDRPGDRRLEACIFLRADDRTCTIHDVRPKQCSLYPWWPGLMASEEWREEKESVCEGFDHPEAGPTDLADAARQLREATKLEAMRLASYERKGRGGGRRSGDQGAGGWGQGEDDDEDEDRGMGGARSAADMPPQSGGGGGGAGKAAPPAGGGGKRERKRRDKADLFDRLMALLDRNGGDGGGGAGGGG